MRMQIVSSQNARRMRATRAGGKPSSRASVRMLHRLKPLGGLLHAVITTLRVSDWLIVTGRPLRGSSLSPAIPSVENRRRHLPTICALHWSRREIAALETPSAAIRIIRALITYPAFAFLLRTMSSNSSLCSSRIGNALKMAPIMKAIIPSLHCYVT